jgi:hypothetical protein
MMQFGWLFLLHVDRLILALCKHFGGRNLRCKGGVGTHVTLDKLSGHFPVTRKRASLGRVSRRTRVQLHEHPECAVALVSQECKLPI